MIAKLFRYKEMKEYLKIFSHNNFKQSALRLLALPCVCERDKILFFSNRITNIYLQELTLAK